MRSFSRETLECRASLIEGIVADRCTIAPVMRLPAVPAAWNRLRDCRATRCRHDNASLAGTVIERCELDGLGRAGPNPFFLWACVFSQVRLRGRLTALKINVEYSMLGADAARQDAWTGAMRAFYADVDWALDITEAEFTSAPSLEAIPGDLVRRDPERQVLVQRGALSGRDVAALPCGVALAWFLERSPFENVVLVGSSDPARRQKDRDALQTLRDLGIAD